MSNHGTIQHDICNRNGCIGVIQEHERDGCSCHINPPCSSCEKAVDYCPVCGYDGQEEQNAIEQRRLLEYSKRAKRPQRYPPPVDIYDDGSLWDIKSYKGEYVKQQYLVYNLSFEDAKKLYSTLDCNERTMYDMVKVPADDGERYRIDQYFDSFYERTLYSNLTLHDAHVKYYTELDRIPRHYVQFHINKQTDSIPTYN